METAVIENRRDIKPFEPLPDLTPEEKRRSDNAAVLSLLWLHYAHGWDLNRIGAETIGRVVAQQLGKPAGDVAKILEAAKEVYTDDVVTKWMAGQIAAGN
jgi:hypothetical protein